MSYLRLWHLHLPMVECDEQSQRNSSAIGYFLHFFAKSNSLKEISVYPLLDAQWTARFLNWSLASNSWILSSCDSISINTSTARNDRHDAAICRGVNGLTLSSFSLWDLGTLSSIACITSGWLLAAAVCNVDPIPSLCSDKMSNLKLKISVYKHVNAYAEWRVYRLSWSNNQHPGLDHAFTP